MENSRTQPEPGGAKQQALAVTDISPKLLRLSCPAALDFRGLLAAIDELHSLTARRPGICVLFDLSAITTPPGFTEQLLVGEHAARQLGHLKKVASVVAAGTRSGLSEGVARKLDLNARVFTSEADALAWLRED